MFGLFKGWLSKPNHFSDKKGKDMCAQIVEHNGRWAVKVNDETIQTYSRKSDATRGATRRGFVVA